MTKEEILAMEAGKKLDILVAENVFGWIKNDIGFDVWFNGNTYTSAISDYSTNILAAWDIVEFIREKGWVICLNSVGEGSGGFIRGTSSLGDWHCNVRGIERNPNHVYEASAPKAICKAALLAVVES